MIILFYKDNLNNLLQCTPKISRFFGDPPRANIALAKGLRERLLQYYVGEVVVARFLIPDVFVSQTD